MKAHPQTGAHPAFLEGELFRGTESLAQACGWGRPPAPPLTVPLAFLYRSLRPRKGEGGRYVQIKQKALAVPAALARPPSSGE